MSIIIKKILKQILFNNYQIKIITIKQNNNLKNLMNNKSK